MSDKPASILSLMQTLAIIGGGMAVLFGGGKWIYDMTVLLATRDYVEEYHQAQMAPIQESMTNIEQSAVVTRIRGLLEARCERLLADNWTDELQGILDEQLDRYFSLTNRQFNIGGCQDGQRIR